MPVPIHFNKEDTAETFMDYKAKIAQIMPFEVRSIQVKPSQRQIEQETEVGRNRM